MDRRHGTETNLLQQIEESLSRHIARQSAGPFRLSNSQSQELGRLVRTLETKRQTSSLTGAEQRLLRELDGWIERIAKFNRQHEQIESAPNAPAGKEEVEEPMVVPQISEAEADRIIHGLNEQFERKVRGQPVRASAPPPPPTTSLGQSDSSGGRNLQDYLSTIRLGQPEIPFADEDSQFDLSKLNKHHHDNGTSRS